MEKSANTLPMLTSSEITALWTAYMNYSMSTCIIRFFLKDVEDVEIRPIVQFTYDISRATVDQISEIFFSEKIPLPIGFTDEDVNMTAPRLYTDMFMLTYIEKMAKAGLLACSGFLTMSERKDIRAFFSDTLLKINQLFNQTTDVMAEKGLLVRSPYINYPTQVDYIDSKQYLSGGLLFSEKRPLNTIEISYLHQNIQTNTLGVKLALSFAQTSPLKEVQEIMIKGANISEKHIKAFTDIFLDDDRQAPAASDISITDSTTPPFTDKLMIYHMTFLSALGIGYYATASASSQRSDLILKYGHLSVEIARYAKNAADIMIKNAWLEQPPTTKDKKLLARHKK